MADLTVQIRPDGSFSPSAVRVRAGDTVAFAAEVDAVLCVAPSTFFGAERFEIPAGSKKELQALTDTPSTLDFIARVGDLSAPCRSEDRDKTGRGGTAGGGLD